MNTIGSNQCGHVKWDKHALRLNSSQCYKAKDLGDQQVTSFFVLGALSSSVSSPGREERAGKIADQIRRADRLQPSLFQVE